MRHYHDNKHRGGASASAVISGADEGLETRKIAQRHLGSVVPLCDDPSWRQENAISTAHSDMVKQSACAPSASMFVYQ